MRHLPDATIEIWHEYDWDEITGRPADVLRGAWDDTLQLGTQSVWHWPTSLRMTGWPPDQFTPCLIFNRYPNLEDRP